MSSPHVMFVCAANVCRSPFMEFAFSSALHQAVEESRAWTVSSAGIDAVSGAAICSFSSAVLSDRLGGLEFVDSHVSTRLTTEDLESSSLVLTATRAERSQIARLNPAARSRVFTLREAVALAALAGSPRTTQLRPAPGADLSAFAAHLHARRGTLQIASRGGWLRWRADPGASLDVSDVHAGGIGPHRRAFSTIDTEVTSLAGALREFRGSL